MFKFLFDLLGSQQFEKPMTLKKQEKRKVEKGNTQRGIPPKAGAVRNNIISREIEAHTETNTQPGDKLITALVLIQEETNSMVVHFNGFETEEHAKSFASKLMKKSGINYNSMSEFFKLPTIH